MVEPTLCPPIPFSPKNRSVFVKNPNFVWEIGVFRKNCFSQPVDYWGEILTAWSAPRWAYIRLKYLPLIVSWALVIRGDILASTKHLTILWKPKCLPE